jgi:exosortase
VSIPISIPETDDVVVRESESVTTTPRQWMACLGLLAVMAWVFWPSLAAMERMWRTDPDQTHGYFVPLFVLYLLWTRWKEAPHAEFGAPLWGLALLIGGLVVRFVGVYVFLDWLQAAALIPCLLGVVALVWGAGTARICLGPLLFLVFMIPLPYRVSTWLAYPLQRTASVSSTYILETLGYYASCIDTKIHIGDYALDVVGACSGLKILVTFFALSVAFALLSPQRVWWERLLIVLAAIPIALAANVLRIVATAVLYQWEIPGLAKSVYHDLAGWLMMPIALLLLGLWTWILSVCVVSRDESSSQRSVMPTAP